MKNFQKLQVKGVEKYREYVYTDGYSYRVTSPVTVFLPTSGPKQQSHRVVDTEGVTHYIPADWRAIRWVGKVIA